MKLAVISGKGGSGKSSVTAAFVSLSSSVLAIDCDVDASNLPLLFSHEVLHHEKFASGEDLLVDNTKCVGCGLCIEKCAFHALEMDEAGSVRATDFGCEGCGLCVRLCPAGALQLVPVESSDIYLSRFSQGLLVHGRLRPGDDNSGKMIARLRALGDEAMRRERIGLQILDGPPGIGCPVLSTVTGVDVVVVVTEPTLSGISDLKRACRVARSFCQEIKVIINKCDVNRENTLLIEHFCREEHLPVVAELPFDRKMVEAQLHCESIITYAPDRDCASRLRRAYHEIICGAAR